MTIYAVRYSTNPYYRYVDYETIHLLDIAPEEMTTDQVLDFSETNVPMGSWWQVPEIDYLDGDEDKPDITIWQNATLLLSPRAHRLLADMMKPYGEFLPVQLEGETHQLFNCLMFGDEDKSSTEFEYDGDQRLGLKTLVFHASCDEILLFKSKSNKGLTTFCNQKFKDALESFKLKGLTFDRELIKQYDE